MTIKKIKNRFEIIKNEISQLIEDQHYFKKYKEYIEESKSVDRQNDFLFFIAKNYQILTLINVCKQVDEDSRSESIVNLLKDIKNNKNLFNLKWYKRQWKPIAGDRKLSRSKEAEKYFKEFSIKNNKLISSQKIDEDIKEMKKAINGLRYGKKKQSIASLTKYRNKRGVHFDKGKPKISVPVVDLYKAIDLLEKKCLKYDKLINQGGMDTLLASNIDSFLEFEKIFKK